jgi:hypothetical protein
MRGGDGGGAGIGTASYPLEVVGEIQLLEVVAEEMVARVALILAEVELEVVTYLMVIWVLVEVQGSMEK